MDEYYQNKKLSRIAKQRSQEQFKNSSRKKLGDMVRKKFQTTMIGALAAFEEEFGELWGNDLAFEDLTPDQIEERERWESVRSHILDNGNDQLRSAIDEISNYTVSWNRYVTKFITKKHDG